EDPPRVADRLATDHQHRHAALTRERLDLGPSRAALGNYDLVEFDPIPAQRPCDPAARTEPIRWGATAIENRHLCSHDKSAHQAGPPQGGGGHAEGERLT